MTRLLSQNKSLITWLAGPVVVLLVFVLLGLCIGWHKGAVSAWLRRGYSKSLPATESSPVPQARTPVPTLIDRLVQEAVGTSGMAEARMVSPSPDAAQVHRDVGGISEGPILSISEVKTTETPDPNAEKNLTLRIGIKKQANAEIDDTTVRTEVFLYDTVNNKDIKPTDAMVNYEWLTKHDWTDTNPEILSVSYVRSKTQVASSGPRKYLGYKVLVYYQDRLEAAQAEPARLLELFRPPLRSQGRTALVKFEQAQQALRRRDYTTARKLVDEADKAQPNKAATLNLRGEILMGQKEFDQAEVSLKKAAKLDPKLREAQYNLAQIPFKKQDYAKARERFEELLKQTPGGDKNPVGELIEFKIYMTLLLEGKESRAQAMMEQFSFTGDTPALYYAHAAWEFKHNNPEKAADWGDSAEKIYSPSLNNVFADAFYDLGWLAAPSSLNHASSSSADQSNVQAETALGYCYATGQGVAKEDTEAAKWYREAAEQNFAQAELNLGNCYANGQGVAKDDAEAVKWYRKAAEQGFAQAQISLALSYALGQGVAKDYVESYKWTLLAANQGDKDAKETMPTLESNMSREQIAEGQKMARNFKPRLAPSASAGPDTSSTGIAPTRPESSGTGFFITEDGYLITNEHVAGSEAQVHLVTREGLISAKVVKVDAANDLALLKAEGKFAALPVSASRTMKLGNTVATVGFPNIGMQEFAPKVARREIGSLSRPQADDRYFQISVPVQPGNSGGALVDKRGNVVGVLSAMLSMKAALATSGAFPQNVSYAVKSSFLLGFLESVPEIAAKLKEPNTKDMKFDDVVEQAKEATALVLVY